MAWRSYYLMQRGQTIMSQAKRVCQSGKSASAECIDGIKNAFEFPEMLLVHS